MTACEYRHMTERASRDMTTTQSEDHQHVHGDSMQWADWWHKVKTIKMYTMTASELIDEDTKWRPSTWTRWEHELRWSMTQSERPSQWHYKSACELIDNDTKWSPSTCTQWHWHWWWHKVKTITIIYTMTLSASELIDNDTKWRPSPCTQWHCQQASSSTMTQSEHHHHVTQRQHIHQADRWQHKVKAIIMCTSRWQHASPNKEVTGVSDRDNRGDAQTMTLELWPSTCALATTRQGSTVQDGLQLQSKITTTSTLTLSSCCRKMKRGREKMTKRLAMNENDQNMTMLDQGPIHTLRQSYWDSFMFMSILWEELLNKWYDTSWVNS